MVGIGIEAEAVERAGAEMLGERFDRCRATKGPIWPSRRRGAVRPFLGERIGFVACYELGRVNPGELVGNLIGCERGGVEPAGGNVDPGEACMEVRVARRSGLVA